MADKDRLKLSKQKRQDMLGSIQSYFRNERDEELGELGAGFILDFFIQELAPEFYNQGVTDACKYMGERVEDVLSIQIIDRDRTAKHD